MHLRSKNRATYGGIYLNAGPTCLTRLGRNHVLSIETVLGNCLSVRSILEKGNNQWAIMNLADANALDITVLHDNTHTARKTQELLRKFKWEVWSHSPTAQIWHQIWVPSTYLEQGSLQRVM
ncbi:hypothetical protein AVEN_126321-1 [Araneus ventricosus]|uniref:Uncharacterized protein n=1 Tax=Araneus ventricosus TaxID=182803 RepID=A0A4Y2FDZ8_ARAVE|nr:hypothetical protein AVEN_126321-1 [Araneus ventricosus]